ncbi:Protein of unknown function [Gryllus bimaculatus]|nr:Protein of unknown function [Gryllus bimaculatus]
MLPLSTQHDVCLSPTSPGEEQEETITQRPSLHQEAIRFIGELEWYAFANNQAEVMETLFGLQHEIENE